MAKNNKLSDFFLSEKKSESGEKGGGRAYIPPKD